MNEELSSQNRRDENRSASAPMSSGRRRWWRSALMLLLATGLFMVTGLLYGKSFGVPSWVPAADTLNAWLSVPHGGPVRS